MHEIGIMQSTLDLALHQAAQNQASKVHLIVMRVGELSGVVPEALEFAFEVLKRETPASEAQLRIEHVAATGWCARCQKEFPVDAIVYDCPQCHQTSRELRRGRELELTSIEIS